MVLYIVRSSCDIEFVFFSKDNSCNALQNFMKRPVRTINCAVVSSQYFKIAHFQYTHFHTNNFASLS